MHSALEFSQNCDRFLGKSYSEMDCQAFVENAMKTVGITKNLAGSNAWYRNMTWVGTPEECKARFGTIPKGALLFILKQDGGEPEKYKRDNVGNASHIGIYTGRTENQMLSAATASMQTEEAKRFKKKCGFGDGAMHSSSTRGCVCTSKFAEKTIKGGWNRVGLWSAFDYGDKINKILSGTPEEQQKEVMPVQMVVKSDNWKGVNFRRGRSTSSGRLGNIPDGTLLEILDDDGKWCKVEYEGRVGYVMKAFLANGNGELSSENGAYSASDTVVMNLSKATAEALFTALNDALIKDAPAFG